MTDELAAQSPEAALTVKDLAASVDRAGRSDGLRPPLNAEELIVATT
jgi:hypothetical protein